MKLHKFRIKNYKSIIDSGDCYASEGITILAGKNEAGKSSLLEALEDANQKREIRASAVPIGGNNLIPWIEIVYEIDKIGVTEIIEKAEISKEARDLLYSTLKDTNTLTVQKTFPSTYALTFEPLTAISHLKPTNWATLLATILSTVATLQVNAATQKLKLPQLNIDPEDSAKAKREVAKYLQSAETPLALLTDSERAEINGHFAQVISAIETQENLNKSIHAHLVESLTRAVPNFVLFSSFDDVFPSQVSFAELSENKWIADLKLMSNLDVTTITGSNRNAKKQHKHQLNLKLNEDFSQFWTQDISELSVDWDNERLEFWVQEHGQFYPPEVRSQGRRWHLAFYIRVAARAREDVQNIILIDEPGLYLHATAQRDILKHLEDASKTSQILFSTHSPYLIEADKLDRLRLIQKHELLGTFVENKIHAVSDKETLTPVLTAIGLEMNQGIVGGDKVDNIIVEGPSDYFYLTAFNELCDVFNGKFVSGGSSGNMPKIGTILQGWGCRVIYLYDNDQAFKDAQRSIKKDWLTISKDWLIPLNVDGAIEDIFSKTEFAAIAGVPENAIVGKNSAFLNSNRRDKVLPARLFLQNTRNREPLNLGKETLEKMASLMKAMAEKFKNYSA